MYFYKYLRLRNIFLKKIFYFKRKYLEKIEYINKIS